jgi:protocatechuate 3,4-dioxygenase beta subunit
MHEQLSRRQALGGLAAGACTAPVAAALPAMAETAPAAAEQPVGVCRLFPQAVEGPYYFDPGLVRSDIAEGRPGLPLHLALRLIDAGNCQPLPDVRVDVWHADARGIYSGYARQGDNRDISSKGERYLRGTQMSDGEGRVSFRTVYPGWYPGRTPHIHFKAFLDKRDLVTGQIYFEDALSARVYRERAPYNARPVADTTNANDFIFRDGVREGGGTVFAVAEEPDRLVASLVIAVDRTGAAARRARGWGGYLRGLIGL